jgi:hypothetical protein
MLDRDIVKLRQIRIPAKGDTGGNRRHRAAWPTCRRWRLGHVLGYNPSVAAP